MIPNKCYNAPMSTAVPRGAPSADTMASDLQALQSPIWPDLIRPCRLMGALSLLPVLGRNACAWALCSVSSGGKDPVIQVIVSRACRLSLRSCSRVLLHLN